jgi:hypothetical protein
MAIGIAVAVGVASVSTWSWWVQAVGAGSVYVAVLILLREFDQNDIARGKDLVWRVMGMWRAPQEPVLGPEAVSR